MERGEVERVVGIWERARAVGQPWIEARMGYSHAENLAHFRDVIALESTVWVALRADQPVGMMALQPGHIDQLHVDPPSHRSGVGRALVEWARARSPEGLELYTARRNRDARAFYEALGFRVIVFSRSPAPEDEPDVLYRWRPTGASK